MVGSETRRTCAKINLGLNVVRLRDDGYHDIETVFLPIPVYDTLTVSLAPAAAAESCTLLMHGDSLDCSPQNNLVVKAYHLLAEAYALPKVVVELHKHIPSQAGLGGGSSDAAAMLRLVNDLCGLRLTVSQMEHCAQQLGADSAFFVRSLPAYAEGIGEKLYPMPGIQNQLCGMRLALVKPTVSISTHEAYAHIPPHYPSRNCLDIVMSHISTWRDSLHNDFEDYVFAVHPQLGEVKRTLYRLGATYASLSGSGSTIYAFFPATHAPSRPRLQRIFPECFTTVVTIKQPE